MTYKKELLNNFSLVTYLNKDKNIKIHFHIKFIKKFNSGLKIAKNYCS